LWGTLFLEPIEIKELNWWPNSYRHLLQYVFDKGTLNSKVKADKVRTLDKSRLVKLVRELGISEIEAIEKALRIHLKL